MTETGKRYTGGCLCGALRYEAQGEPLFAGHCYCTDCQKSSGSGFIPFMGFASSALRITVRPALHIEGGKWRGCGAQCLPDLQQPRLRRRAGKSDSFTIYAGSLDDPSSFHPTAAIFASSRPPWAVIPQGLKVFDRMPSDEAPRQG